MSLLDQHTSEIYRLCAQYKVKRLYAFGSVFTASFKSNSDIDLIVDFETLNLEEYADNYFELKHALENTLQHPIDLLEAKTIKNPYFLQAVEAKRKLIYAN